MIKDYHTCNYHGYCPACKLDKANTRIVELENLLKEGALRVDLYVQFADSGVQKIVISEASEAWVKKVRDVLNE